MIFIIFIVLLICIGIVILFVLYDFIYHFNIWQGRIHIGRWSNVEEWHTAVLNRSNKWLKKTPIVSKIDNQRLILLDVLSSNYRSSTIQSWQVAGLLMGTRSTIINIPNVTNIDVASTAYAVLCNISNPIDVKSQMDKIYSLILNTKGSNDTIPYRKEVNNIRFVDTIGLVCPFLVKYGITYNSNDAIKLAEKQIREYSTFFNVLTGTPPHAFDIVYQVPLGVYDWGRGVGWYILGIVECYKNLNKCDFKEFLKEEIIHLTQSLLRFQLPSGGFASSIFNTTSFAESSASILCGLLFIECYSITLDVKYKNAAEKIISYLMSVTQRNGAIDMCQGDTKGIGNYSTKYYYMPFAQGLAVVLAERYKNANT